MLNWHPSVMPIECAFIDLVSNCVDVCVQLRGNPFCISHGGLFSNIMNYACLERRPLKWLKWIFEIFGMLHLNASIPRLYTFLLSSFITSSSNIYLPAYLSTHPSTYLPSVDLSVYLFSSLPPSFLPTFLLPPFSLSTCNYIFISVMATWENRFIHKTKYDKRPACPMVLVGDFLYTLILCFCLGVW